MSETAARSDLTALDPLEMLLDAARFADSIKPEWAKAARKAVAAARLAASQPDREADSLLIKSLVLPMVHARSREPNDAWDKAAKILEGITSEATSMDCSDYARDMAVMGGGNNCDSHEEAGKKALERSVKPVGYISALTVMELAEGRGGHITAAPRTETASPVYTAESILSLLSGAGTKSDGGVVSQILRADALPPAKVVTNGEELMEYLDAPSDPSPGPDVSLSVPVGEPRATKKVYIKPLRTIVEIQNVYADKIRDLLNTRPPPAALEQVITNRIDRILEQTDRLFELDADTSDARALNDRAVRELRDILSALTRPLGGFVQEETPLRMQESSGAIRSEIETTLWRHKQRGTVYRVLHNNVPMQENRTKGRALDDEPMVVYQDVGSGAVYVRPVVEMWDGRFEAVAEKNAREGSESPPPAVFTDPTPT